MQMHNNSYSSYGFQGNPPSMLGFVCKPDMPPHINILFRARPPLEFIPTPDRKKPRRITGLNDNDKNIVELFEKTAPKERPPVESKRILKLKDLLESIEKNKAENREKLKTCKYFNINIYFLLS
jgi:hypothetical protein